MFHARKKNRKPCNKTSPLTSYYYEYSASWARHRGYSTARTVLLRKGEMMRILVCLAVVALLCAPGTICRRVLSTLDPEYSPIVAATVPDGFQRAVTLCGGEDANCRGAGPTITGVNRGIYCLCSSPTVSNCHFLRNLSVGMEGLLDAALCVRGAQLAGDTKPTIATCIFAAGYQPGIIPGEGDLFFCMDGGKSGRFRV
jgi:hypothetical protein